MDEWSLGRKELRKALVGGEKIEPDFCMLYPWPDSEMCPEVGPQRGGHICDLREGHKEPCRCAYCEKDALFGGEMVEPEGGQ